jgi:hypothetical protein
MINHLYGPQRISILLAFIGTFMTAYVMAGVYAFREQVFLNRGIISLGGELSILIAIITMVLLNIVSILWLWSRVRTTRPSRWVDYGLLVIGFLVLALFAGEKILVDEISHEYSVESETTGEWIVLYVCLGIQLCYSIAILLKLVRLHHVKRGHPNVV